MYKALIVAACMSVAGLAQAADCNTTATEKKLAGAAKDSFMKKCLQDTCGAQAAEKKLAGAAKNSFTKKCIKDAGGKAA